MNIKPVVIPAGPGAEASDLCSRSGLISPDILFVTLYTRDLSRLKKFYSDIFGVESLRFDGGEIVCFTLGNGFELLLQQVPEDSAFAKLVGTQSVGLGRDGSKASQRLADVLGKAQGRTAVHSEGGPSDWDVDVAVGKDPDGNILQIVGARQAADAGR
jgi:catechol 2,3-dioxygenase-like lactoylglutathione lyase family enzyme